MIECGLGISWVPRFWIIKILIEIKVKNNTIWRRETIGCALKITYIKNRILYHNSKM